MAQSAEQLTLAAVPIVAVLMLQAGPGEIGVIAAVQSLPFLLLSIPLGLLADRMSLPQADVGDLVVIFADDVTQTWKQVIYWGKPEGEQRHGAQEIERG